MEKCLPFCQSWQTSLQNKATLRNGQFALEPSGLLFLQLLLFCFLPNRVTCHISLVDKIQVRLVMCIHFMYFTVLGTAKEVEHHVFYMSVITRCREKKSQAS